MSRCLDSVSILFIFPGLILSSLQCEKRSAKKGIGVSVESMA